MRLIVLIAPIHRTDPTAVTLLTAQAVIVVMALILPEAIFQAAIRVEVQAHQI